MAANTKKIGFTFLQMLVGGCGGLLVGLVLLGLINLIWRNIDASSLNGIIKGLLLLISFCVLLGGTIATTAEAVRIMGRFIPRETSRRRIYEGSFLGLCTAVAVLSATRSDWLNALEEWGGPIKLIATLLYFVVVLPIKLVTFWIPALVLLFIAAPIGAAIGYNLSVHTEANSDADHPENKERKKR